MIVIKGRGNGMVRWREICLLVLVWNYVGEVFWMGFFLSGLRIVMAEALWIVAAPPDLGRVSDFRCSGAVVVCFYHEILLSLIFRELNLDSCCIS